MFGKLARFNLLYCLFVIAWGAWVRLSDSGDGCGQHWPLCEGEVIPRFASLEKWTEFFHRATSGLFGITVLWQASLAWRAFGHKHIVCVSSLCALVLTFIEALIGAWLVKKGLVAEGRDPLRIVVMPLHLANTFLLLSALTVADFWRDGEFQGIKRANKWFKSYSILGVILLLGVMVLGAMAALAHDWFPFPNLYRALEADFGLGGHQHHWLLRLRIFHPFLAILAVAFIFTMTCHWRRVGLIHAGESWAFLVLLSGQLLMGALNWVFMAPAWSALIHLVLADFIWIGFIRQICYGYRRGTG